MHFYSAMVKPYINKFFSSLSVITEKINLGGSSMKKLFYSSPELILKKLSEEDILVASGNALEQTDGGVLISPWDKWL